MISPGILQGILPESHLDTALVIFADMLPEIASEILSGILPAIRIEIPLGIHPIIFSEIVQEIPSMPLLIPPGINFSISIKILGFLQAFLLQEFLLEFLKKCH